MNLYTHTSIVINYVGSKGGGPVYTYEMAKGLINNGCKVYLITSNRIENLNELKKLGFVDIMLLPGYKSFFGYFLKTTWLLLFGIPKIKRRFSKIKIDCCYAPMETLWGGYINKVFKNSQIITTLHDPTPHSTNTKNKIQTIIGNFCRPSQEQQSDDIVILSECFKNLVCSRYGFPQNRVHVIPHGNFDYYFDVSQKKEHNYPAGRIHFLFFGRIDKYKGLHFLADVYKMFSNVHPDVSLSVVGSGDFSEYKTDFENLRNIEIINRWIKDEEVSSFFLTKNVVLLVPYTDATQSGVIPIALSAKCLVIASKTGGLEGQISDGVSGLLFEPNNPKSFLACLENAYSNPALIQKLVFNGKRQIADLSWDKLSEKLIQIISD